jgi:hypothetical protein
LENTLASKAVNNATFIIADHSIRETNISIANEPKKIQSPLFLLSGNTNNNFNDEEIKSPSFNKFPIIDSNFDNPSISKFESY